MGFMDKNINFILIFIIVIILMSLIGLTVYYQKSFKVLSERYITESDRAAILEKEVQALNEVSTQLNQTLILKSTDIANLSSQYVEEKEGREFLNSTLKQTERDLEMTQSILDNTKSELSVAKSDLATTKSQLSTASAAVSALNGSVASYRSYVVQGLGQTKDLLDYVMNLIAANSSSSCNPYFEEIRDNVGYDINVTFRKMSEI